MLCLWLDTADVVTFLSIIRQLVMGFRILVAHVSRIIGGVIAEEYCHHQGTNYGHGANYDASNGSWTQVTCKEWFQ